MVNLDGLGVREDHFKIWGVHLTKQFMNHCFRGKNINLLSNGLDKVYKVLNFLSKSTRKAHFHSLSCLLWKNVVTAKYGLNSVARRSLVRLDILFDVPGDGLCNEKHELGADLNVDGQIWERVWGFGRSNVRHGGRHEPDDRHKHPDGRCRRSDEAGGWRGRNWAESWTAERRQQHYWHGSTGRHRRTGWAVPTVGKTSSSLRIFETNNNYNYFPSPPSNEWHFVSSPV